MLKLGWTRYAVVTLLAWGLMPELRRVIDYKRGAFQPVELASVVPLAMLVPFCAYAVLGGWRKTTPKFRLFATIWLAANGYALVVGIVSGSPFAAAVYEFAGFCAPVAFGVWMCAEASRRAALYRIAVWTLLGLGAASSLYAVAQYVSPFPWDGMWIYASGFMAAGYPVPFEMRAWGTMNSPGPFADYLVCTILLSLPLVDLRKPLALAAVLLCGIGLAVTFVRSDWAALAVGFAVYVVFSPQRRFAIVGVSSVVALVTALFISAPALGGDAGSLIVDHVTDRFSTIDTLDTDVSALTRQKEIDNGIESGIANPIGVGLGVVGTAAKLDGEGADDIAIDSGYISRFDVLGFLGMAGYLLVTVGSLWQALAAGAASGARANRDRSAAIVASAALFAALLTIDFAVDAHASFDGILFWIAMAIAFGPSGEAQEVRV